jgi:pseudomonalisin
VTGQGQAVSIIGAGDLTQVGKDLVTFENQFGLPHVPLNVIKVDGGSADTSGQDEWDLDTQYSSGFAPNVSAINFYAGPSLSDQSLLDATAQWVIDDKTSQGSASLGECETDAQSSGFLAAEDQVLMQASAQGQTLFVSSGDTGSRCGTQNGTVSGPKGVSYPASSPFVVGVGGTTITDFANHTEVGWHPSGGGMSPDEMAPSFQTKAGGAFHGSARGVPDVALDADPNSGYQVVINGQLFVIGGTSAGAPSWNGIWARAEQQNSGKLGFAAPLLYNLPASAFNDITSGNNGDFTAGPGWDYVTGRGTPNIGAVVSQVGG